MNPNNNLIHPVDTPYMGVSFSILIPNLQKNVFGYSICGIDNNMDIGILIKETRSIVPVHGGFGE